jgi:hypothetical protein
VDNEELPAAAAITDSFANPTTTQIAAMDLIWNPRTSVWERRQGNAEVSILVSGYLGLAVILDITVNGAGGSITLEIDGKDPVSGKYFPLLTGAAETTVVSRIYRVYPTIARRERHRAGRALGDVPDQGHREQRELRDVERRRGAPAVMPTGALLLLGNITRTRPFPQVEPFNLGSGPR